MNARHYGLIIPALDEAESIGELLQQIPGQLFSQVIVVDNGSRDDTEQMARRGGAEVAVEPRRGYGQACRAGLALLRPETAAVVFMDADLSDDPRDVTRLVECFEQRRLDLVIGSRVLGSPEPGSLAALQRFGNWVTTRLIRWIWDVAYTDLGPLRIVRRDALMRLNLGDRDFGWNVEMQAKAASLRLRVDEVPVHYRKRRLGKSKISGSLPSSLRAGFKILWTIYRCWRTAPKSEKAPEPIGV